MATSLNWVENIAGDFPIHKNVLALLPPGTTIVSAERSGVSAWAKTAKISVVLPDGNPKTFFFKGSADQRAHSLVGGEFHSFQAISEVIEGGIPTPYKWGNYEVDGRLFYFFLNDFHDMDLDAAPEPGPFVSKVAEMHENGTSPNGMFGYSVPTVIGRLERTVTWEKSWEKSFTHQLQDVIKYDNDSNGPWPELAAACEQLIDAVIPRLLGILETGGRSIKPSLIHGSLWENNVGVDMETGETIIFDPGCTYAHNEMEFGTWRCSWAFHFKSPIYMRLYQQLVEPSEPAEEWDDRNRLYSLHPYFVDSAGHPGSISRQIAYNDILFLCEKYAPLDTLEKYDPEKDLAVTGGNVPFVVSQ